MTLISPVNAAPANTSANMSVWALSAHAAASAQSASSAHAAARARSRISHKDRIRDVRSAAADNTTALKRNKRNKTADIVTVKASHGRKLVVSVKTRKAMPKSHMGVVVRVKTGAGEGNYDFQLDFTRNILGQGNGLTLRNYSYEPVTCGGLKVKRSKAKHLITLTVPSRCIGSPQRAKVGLATIVEKSDKVFIDDGFDTTSNGVDLARSHWIRRR